MKYNSQLAEKVAKWYLRFNGYFIVENFIVHAGEDDQRISNGLIGNHTEVDLLGIRHKFSKEKSGILEIQNDQQLINGSDCKIDFVIVEVKTGKENKPNKLWREKKIQIIEYIVRFAGFIENTETIVSVANQLAETNNYNDPNGEFSIRLIVISENPLNKNWNHLLNISIDSIIDFFVDVRGGCWINQNLGIASLHSQWEPIISDILKIANEHEIEVAVRKERIRNLLSE